MKTSAIQALLCKDEILKNNLPCENISWLLLWEADVLSLNKSGFLTEFEVKISRSDFLAEKKKASKWRFMDSGIEKGTPNYFWYVCLDNLIKIEEVPAYSGLIYVNESGFTLIKSAKRRHKFVYDRTIVTSKFAKVLTERKYLGSCRMTYENRLIRERNKAWFAD